MHTEIVQKTETHGEQIPKYIQENMKKITKKENLFGLFFFLFY